MPSQQRQLPGASKAAAFLGESIGKLVAQGATRLPTIHQMAGLAGVSPTTMHKAVRECQARGLLLVSHGSGIRVAAVTHHVAPEALVQPADSSAAGRRTGWHRLKLLLERDIVEGRLHPAGPVLPRYKELAARYGASYRTLRKALDDLSRSGRIEPWKTGYRIRTFPAAALTRNAITLVVRGSEHYDTVGTWAPRNHEQFHSLAVECGKAGIDLDFAVFRFTPKGLVGPDGSSRLRLADRGGITNLGFLVWTQGLGALDLPEFVAHLLEDHGRPVAVLDTGAADDFRPLLHAGSRVKVFALGTTPRCGEAVGRYLLELGHRSVAYVTEPADPSSRAQGLRAVFERAGYPQGLRMFAYQPVRVSGQQGVEARLTRRLDRRRTPDQVIAKALRRHGERLEGYAGQEARMFHMGLALDEALRWKDATAWVVHSDEAAVRCLEYLRSRGVRVPEDISVAGFDDIEEAFLRGLSSYNFDVPAIVHAMVDHVLHPEPLRSDSGRRAIEVDGFVNVRRTTAPPRRHTIT